MLVLSESDVGALIDPGETIALAAEAFRQHSAGVFAAAARATLARAMPRAGALIIAGLDGDDLAIKSNVHAYAQGPDAARGWGSLLTLWNLTSCRPRALISATLFNDARTAAGLAVAAKAWRPQARVVALYGVGKTATACLLYLRAVLPALATIILVGRRPEPVAALARRLAAEPALAGVAIETGLDAMASAASADIIVTLTTSSQPVFPGAAPRPGTLVILAGANRPDAREADDALMARALVVADSLDNAAAKAGDVILGLAAGALTRERLAGEIGALIDGPAPTRPGTDILVFKSTGLAAQDLLLARRLLEKALAAGLGQQVDLAGAPS